jgi:hypothetical protein
MVIGIGGRHMSHRHAHAGDYDKKTSNNMITVTKCSVTVAVLMMFIPVSMKVVCELKTRSPQLLDTCLLTSTMICPDQ